MELRHGLDGFGSQLVAPDLPDDPRSKDFLLTRAQLIRVQQFAQLWSWRADALAQLSGDVLPDTERFKIGGDRLGRGFEVAEIAGDSGVGAKVELRRQLPAAPDVLGKASAYAYYDFGAAWKEDAPGRESAATAGIGVGLRGVHAAGYLELAMPLTHTDIEGSDSLSVFAEVSVPF
jgi:hemolysin activation/secretion protein